MSSTSPSRENQGVQSVSIRFPDFEVSWAGIHPSIDGYCFGSDDGRFRMAWSDGFVTSTRKLVDSGEAINGIAFSGKVTAASTRCEVVFHNPVPDSEGGGISTYNGGAHGVLATSAGGFVAPLGRDGLLRATLVEGAELRMFVDGFRDDPVNFYKLAHLHGDGARDVIAAATRRDGISTFDLVANINNGRPGSSHYFKAPGLDVVDLCSLDSHEWPFAIAALGADGAIHLFRDILGQEQPMSLRLDDLIGASYTILHSQGHIFLLTSKAFYTFPNLASLFLGNSLGDRRGQACKEEMMAVDAYVSRDEILIVMGDEVRVASVVSLASGSSSSSEPSSGTGSTLNIIEAPGMFSPGPDFSQERAA
jgi:hypothetical protein